ncbi:thioredoxin TrxC [Granulosicoccaceae sp. 1_MG-2023]|nr:thioredoxin TrxC [Granulosicoccaceae sp. 1_MG-2023]
MSDIRQIPCAACQAVNRVPAARLGDNPRCGRCQAALLPAAPIDVDEATFRKLMSRSDVPVVADFWAAWCGPCKMMAPVFAQTAAAMQGKALFIKVDTEQAPQVSASLGIRSIPTLAVFKRGQELARQAGAMDATGLQRWLSGVI